MAVLPPVVLRALLSPFRSLVERHVHPRNLPLTHAGSTCSVGVFVFFRDIAWLATTQVLRNSSCILFDACCGRGVLSTLHVHAHAQTRARWRRHQPQAVHALWRLPNKASAGNRRAARFSKCDDTNATLKPAYLIQFKVCAPRACHARKTTGKAFRRWLSLVWLCDGYSLREQAQL